MCGRITPHMGRIPIPTLIKAILWKLLVCTHNNIHVHDEAATYHITFAIISCRKRAEWCHRCGMLRLHVCPTNQPACQPSIIIIQLGVRTHLCRGQSRADQSQAAYNAGTIANTSDDIDYSIGRSMNRLWLSLRGSRYDQKELEPWTRCYYYHGQLWWVTRSCWLVTCLRFKVSVSSRLAWISHGQETFWTQEELCPPITLIKSIAIGMAWRMYRNNLRPVA